MNRLAVALNRFGLGAKPGEVSLDNPFRWLLEQLTRFRPEAGRLSTLPSSQTLATEWLAAVRGSNDLAKVAKMEARKAARKQARERYRDAADARSPT